MYLKWVDSFARNLQKENCNEKEKKNELRLKKYALSKQTDDYNRESSVRERHQVRLGTIV